MNSLAFTPKERTAKPPHQERHHRNAIHLPTFSFIEHLWRSRPHAVIEEPEDGIKISALCECYF